jgi:hypothetical protein
MEAALNIYGRLPRRVPGAALRALSNNQAMVGAARWPATNPNHNRHREEPRRRSWFNAAFGVAKVPRQST